MIDSRRFLKQGGSLVALAFVFVAISYLAHQYKYELMNIIRNGGIVGLVGFVILTAIFVIFIIPLDIAFLIPIGVVVWGPILTALMSIIGWTLGAGIAFMLARQFGISLIEKLIGLERIYSVEQRIPKRNLFGLVILLRMLVSVDILSYALGLFSTMPAGQYLLATTLGVTPFGFYFAYAGALPFWYQILAIGAAIILAAVVLVKYGVEREP